MNKANTITTHPTTTRAAARKVATFLKAKGLTAIAPSKRTADQWLVKVGNISRKLPQRSMLGDVSVSYK